MNSKNVGNVKPRPQRAEPLQPDRPGVGGGRLKDKPKPSPEVAEKKSREQSRTALQNVSEGYGD